MKSNAEEQSAVSHYLLGLLQPSQQQSLEERLLTDASFYEELQIAKDDLSHDIHISLVDSPTVTKADECQSVVAEMSPHHRPDSWNKTTMAKVAARKVPVRVTGQLLFDSSHFICKNGARVDSNPSRSSLWEIHPVYKFEVCTAGCTGAGTWVPLDQWAKTH